ncbi:MAG: efflux RND transporter periplasmic adaptor subunit [Acidobacteria bacterium]|nr:efflux RND transporter periplasmic adaptor subunit [Acidobacteriota bacterium]
MRRLILTAGAVILICLTGIGLFGAFRTGSSTTVPTMRVTAGSFRLRVTAEGTLETGRATPITVTVRSRRPMTIAWKIDDGAPVREGQVLFRFDATDFNRELETGQTDRRKSDYEIGNATTQRESTLSKLSLDADLASKELEVSRNYQSTDEQVFSKLEILSSAIDTRLAGERKAHAEASFDIQGQLAAAGIELLEIEGRKADLKIEMAKDALNELEITAPHDGIIVFERNWQGQTVQIGETCWPGQTLAGLPDLETLQAEVWVLEADAGGIKAGNPVVVTVESRPERPFEGVVSSIDPIAQRRVRWVPVQYFRVVVELLETDLAIMKPGARVKAEIVTADLEDALTVPRQAVGADKTQLVVWRFEGGEFSATPVELGPTSVSRVVIASGIEAGDRVALREPTSPNGGSGTQEAGELPGGNES